jgi:hypothetical protein
VARILAALGRIDGRPVDYGALTLRHLSAVGEGLLESTLWVVEPSAGQVAVLNTRGEAYALSSTPLPDYVGLPAMERALAQVLEAREERYRKAMDAVVRLRHEARDGLGQPGDHAGVAASEQAASEQAASEQAASEQAASEQTAAEQAACDALLGIKVLDPTMGLGTFLISALDILVDGIMECVARYHRGHPWLSWESDPIVCMLREVRGALMVEMEAQGFAQDPELLGDEVLLAWLLSQRALYGVDLSSTAVVLSRALVGLRAFVPGAPLPFLGGHLIQGDSLRSVRLADLVTPASAGNASEGDAGVLDFSPASVTAMWRAAGLDPTLAETAALRDPEGGVAATAAALQAEYGLLHWDLVFPEVFLDPVAEVEAPCAAAPGFDVVISNPPSARETVQAGRWGENSFLEVARRLICKPHGRIAFVMVPPIDSTGA